MSKFLVSAFLFLSLTACASSERKANETALITRCNAPNASLGDPGMELCSLYDRKASDRLLAKKKAEFNRNLEKARAETKAHPEKYQTSGTALRCTGTNYGGSGLVSMTCY
ncbi:Skp family chaperone for outer membrane proteins [Ochrobactrum daejeonense]|uniref:Skp family chaperone for outer membrane proteins n=1 Tax=Brucella daejeonensis TaxID=659015 RepID=A0A7W9ELA9_9HYPH|nr:hypothetical protein [Brucella daejeonensis]MBB5702132.1 Skp family chaperone for outer membrane proteins [Brucella daejeonensis]NKB80024.1 hypothetical protein [Brucella daejeonensis]